MLKLKRVMKTGVFAVSFGIASTPIVMSSSARLEPVEAVDVAPRAFAFRMAGDFAQTGRPVDAPLVTVARTSVLHIMKHQVTVAEYDRCVAEARCLSHPRSESSDPNRRLCKRAGRMRLPMRAGFPRRLAKHGVFPRTRNGFSQPGRVFMTMHYRLPPRATPPCVGLPVTIRNQRRRHWISGRALPEPSAQMNTDCSICRGMSGNGRIPASFGSRLTRWASPLARRSSIAGCESSKANTAPL
jgi:hypothetical protein